MSLHPRRRALFCLAGLGALAAAPLCIRPAASEVNQVTKLAEGVYFHEGDLKGHGHCNNGWVVFNDYVLVVDANFPSGALEVIPKIKASTDKPIRFAFDTHHHGDHAYGNQVWVENGAVPVAHVGVIQEMKKYETGYYGGKPGRWEESASGPKPRADVAASKLKPPTLLFPKQMIFDDGEKRLELVHLGVAHTHGDGFAWMPKEKILFTGDACVNGPYNYVGDGSVTQWIKTLEAAQKLGARTVVPGHGPVGTGSLLEDQRQYFLQLRAETAKLRRAYPQPARAQARVDQVRQALRRRPRIRRYVGDMFADQVAKVWVELGGRPFPSKKSAQGDRERHAMDHRLELLRFGPPMSWPKRLAAGR